MTRCKLPGKVAIIRKDNGDAVPKVNSDTVNVDKKKDPVLLLVDLLKKAKANPWVLVAAAIGGGTGGQETLKQVFGQNVQWWWIASAVVAYGLLSYLADAAKRQEKMASAVERAGYELKEIKETVQGVAENAARTEASVEDINRWRKDVDSKLAHIQ